MNNYNKKKKYYPAKKSGYHYPVKQHKPPTMFGGFFNGNLANNMRFGRNGDELSGYVKREIYMKDQHGNVQRAKETQFFNSATQLGTIRIRDDNDDEYKYRD